MKILPSTPSSKLAWLSVGYRSVFVAAIGVVAAGLISGCSPSPPDAPDEQAVSRADPRPGAPNAATAPQENQDEAAESRQAEVEEPLTKRSDDAAVRETFKKTGDAATSADAGQVDTRPLQAPAAATTPRRDSSAADAAADAAADSAAADVQMDDLNSGRSPAEMAAEKAFAEPEDARRLTPDARLWIDPKRGRLIVDGYVTLREGPLEMFACPVGTKEHESVVSVLSLARYVHAGLLAIDAMPGTPVSFSPEYRPATGQRIAIWVMWRNAEGEIKKVPAQQWIQQTGTNKPLDTDWVFAGSSFWRDPATGQEYYQADSGDLVCVSNFSTATLDLPVESSQSNAALQYSAFTEHIPPRGTPVRLVFIPIPLPSDEPEPRDEPQGSAEPQAGDEPQAEGAMRVDPRAPPEDALLKEPVKESSK